MSTRRQIRQALKKNKKQKQPSQNEIQTLVNFFNQGRYLDALPFAEKMTKDFPKLGFGWKAFGLILTMIDRMEEALEAMRKSVEFEPNDAEAYSNLGNLLQDLGRFAEAEIYYLKAIELKPDYADAYNNLGNVLQDLGRLAEAEIFYLKAIELKPDYAKAYNNLGNVLKDLGRLTEAETFYIKAIELKPDFAEFYSNLGDILYYLDYIDKAMIAYRDCIKLSPFSIGLNAYVHFAIHYYLSGNLKDSYASLEMSNKILDMSADKKYKNSANYWKYLNKLHSWHKNNKQEYNQTKEMKKIYVVGESHSLTTHGVIVKYNSSDLVCKTELILGCKQWHLGNTVPNVYKHKFEAIMARLPKQSIILLTIGEIDCRHDEGIMKVWKKSNGKSLEDITFDTIRAYLSYVNKITSQYKHQVIINGVPAVNSIESNNLPENIAKESVNMVKLFNMILEREALLMGMEFLDVYSATVGEDEKSNKKWHIDDYHLTPLFYTQADKWLIKPEVKKQEPITIDFSKHMTINLTKPS